MNRLDRKNRTRFKLKKISSRKRLSVFRSNNHLYAQIINDEQGITLACASTLEKTFQNKKNISKKELAEDLGKEIAKRSIKKGIKEVAFDKGKYKYHGIIKILAEAARAGGLDF
ncbi:MAG: 50S ribosomal protein L18 [Pelagibacteraceae bacterium]|jgi:large subunit ribosomal protein L18|nr:50S ribosomal protein L18 [Pelagibacteraceae bacterium]MDP6784451.1 50S ribosomal protein L18 [Alphaproteobacteria bacterium]MBO6465896.1 50S ribosomal protein L18 [Pelagibacteraceae bacterium]MBO6467588.1 50S ribosomal protein L18 [Pelagibacteraceae bacterium]MBO6468858.1 50S ribosomal protein L18 [Pelagibacteraceae bacterium]